MKIVSIDIETTGLNFSEHQVLEIGACIFDTESPEFKPIATYKRYINNPFIHGDYFAIQMNVDILRKIIELQNISKKYWKAFYKLEKLRLLNFTDSSLKEECDEHYRQMEMQQSIVDELQKDSEALINPDNIAKDFKNWLVKNGAYYCDKNDKPHLNITGKNFWGFDNRFLENIVDWSKNIHPHRRSFDPANLYYESADEVLPSLEDCKKRALAQSQKYLSLNSYESLFIDTNVTHDALDDSMDVAKLVFFAIKRDEFFYHVLHDNLLTLKKNEKE